MNILKPIYNAYEIAKNRNWDTIYWAIDLHGTIVKSNYDKDGKLDFYPYSKKVLKLLSENKKTKLILYSCTYEKNLENLIEELKNYSIKFDYINENPEAKNTNYGDYSKKPYFNILLEDKSGFEPEVDWKYLFEFLEKNIKILEKNLID